VERIKAGMRRRKLEGYSLGRVPLSVDHQALVRDRLSGMSLTKVAKKYGVSRSSVVRFTREAVNREAAQLGDLQPAASQAPAEYVS
jgi:DNA invertase Pin-like site-specific DNA recombinase